MAVGKNPEHRLFGERLNLPEAWLQDFDIAAELIDYQALDARLLGFGEEFHRPVERGKHTAAVYVSDQDDRGIDRLGKPHVHNVVGAEVNLRRGTRTFNYNDILLGR